MLETKKVEDDVLTKEEISKKRKIICEKLFFLQYNYNKKNELEQKRLDVEIRKHGKELEKLVLPRRTAASLYKKYRNY